MKIDPKFIVDAGANAGYSSVFFSNMYPDARIIAIEPKKSNYEMLLRNAKEYPHISPINAALWSRKAHLEITNPDSQKSAIKVRAKNYRASNSVKSITIEDILQDYSGDIDILKLDIEGAEKEIFDSNSELWLEKIKVIIIELHDFIRNGSGCSVSFYRAVTPYEFKQYVIGENIVLVMQT